ncbi:alpha/beta-hydrolase [Sordaria brevicollis]|uniref:Alpha/beta-hydrolase n=1 Tax=Sordaria brevicollis TaxID=83679 RepID=A0AAE0P3K9_SORBR|nr:alpha/beta-hydrolase [Sordaria brevicollis]
MIDHLLGRPSVKSRRLQVLAVLGFWSAYLFKGDKHGPPGFRIFSRLLTRRLTTWQTVILTMIYLYAARNFSTLVGLASPEPMANMYDATYFRATWVLTALDAGFWTAMKIKQKWLRDISSIAFSIFYLVAAEKADEKVRKVRGNLTIEHLRVSWNKGVTSPYLRFLQNLVRPRFTRWPPRQIRIPRPATSDYKDPVAAWLYYDGPLADLEHHNKIILDIPGGGFVAMDPRCNDDKLFSWAAKTGLPILSLDYKKAPEFPYPYALNECYDVYSTIIKTKGRCIGLSGREVPKIVVTGDSAGGTLATSMTLMIVESGSSPVRRFQGEVDLKVPDGLILFYPALDMNIGSWMSDEQMALIKDRRMRGTNKRIVQRKTSQYTDLVGTPAPSDDEDDGPSSGSNPEPSPVKEKEPSSASRSAPEYAHSGPSTWSHNDAALPASKSEKSKAAEKQKAKSSAVTTTPTAPHNHHPQPLRTRLAMSSMISYFADRVLTPEMMRAMIILYVGPHNRPDFSSDYLLCPILAPDILLSRFPKTYFLTGERDPLVDDTVIFAGRLKRVKAAMIASDGQRTQYKEEDIDEALRKTNGKWDEKQAAEVALVPGISHGFLQFPGVYPPAWGLFGKIAGWMGDVFAEAERKEREEERLRRKMATMGIQQPAELTAESKSGGKGGSGKGVGFGAVEEHNADERAGRPHRRRHGSGGSEESSGEEEDKPLEMGKVRTRGRAALKTASHETGNASTEGAVVDDEVHLVEGDEEDEAGSDTATEAAIAGTTTATTANTKVKAKKPPRRMKPRRVKTGDEDEALLVRLDSSDDILGRRMQGLAGGLTGLPEAE